MSQFLRVGALVAVSTMSFFAFASPADAVQDPTATTSDGVITESPSAASRPEMTLPDTGLFSVPDALKTRVDFWKKVYSKYTTRQQIIHDREHMEIVFEIVDFDKIYGGKGVTRQAEQNYLRARRAHYQNILRNLARRGGAPTTEDERRIVALYEGVSGGSGKYAAAVEDVRSQLGQADRFRVGLIRSGRYMDHIRSVLRSYGLPQELAALPHVESSFNYQAYSSVGAAGIWQFTRGTGRLFMRVDYTVDERRDPVTATVAAARLLKQNYDELGAWPLAITAYNHGTNGMKRAKSQHGDDIARVIDNYRSRSFGFASKNFYCEFLAALHVARNYRDYFGPLDFEPEFRYDELTLDHYIPIHALADNIGVDVEALKKYNPALRQSVWKGNRHIPKGFALKIPHGHEGKAVAALAALPDRYKKSEQKNNGWHIVRRGDTLSGIARHYRVSLNELRSANDKRSDFLRVGQKLRIPGSESIRSTTLVAAIAPTVEAPQPGDAHLVRRGDSLYSIARRHGMSVDELTRINGLSLRATIYPGQRLALAAGETLPQVASVAPMAVDMTAPATDDSDNEGDALDATLTEATTGAAQSPVVEADGESVLVGGRTIKIAAADLGVRRISGNVGEIVVDAEETLGHYAEWLETSGTAVQRLNRKNLRRFMSIGQTVRIPLGKVRAEAFIARRLEYHLQLLEDFFEAYKVEGEKTVSVRRGQSLWDLCAAESDTPLWLVKLYNPDTRLQSLTPGQTIVIPVVEKK
jgi:membrane-bound lytic murein transglycosylase D